MSRVENCSDLHGVNLDGTKSPYVCPSSVYLLYIYFFLFEVLVEVSKIKIKIKKMLRLEFYRVESFVCAFLSLNIRINSSHL